MSWQAFILLSVVLVSFRILVTRALMRQKHTRESALTLNALTISVVYVVGLIYAVFHHVDTSGLSMYWPNLLAGGLFFGIANAFSLKLFSYVDGAIGTVMSTAAVFFTVVFAWLFLGEHLTVMQLAGTAILIPTIIYVVLLDRSENKLNLNSKAITTALIYTSAAGVALTNEKHLLSHMSIASYLVFGWGAQVLMSWLLAASETNKLHILKDRRLWRSIFLIGLFMAGGGLTFIEAQVLSNNLSVVTIISSFRLIVIALLAGWLLHERKYYFQKIYASAVAVVGVVMMMWK